MSKSKLKIWLSKIVRHQYFLILILWLILTGFNLNKAFHIDDAFHLEASEYIKSNPLRPMSGYINWDETPSPFYEHNQPPLFFYMIALVSSVFGANEIPLHLLISIFTFFSLYFFVKIARLLGIKNINTLLVFFAFCPGFIVNQNVMTDVPVLALLLGSVYFLLKARKNQKHLHYCLASFLIGVGVLIKYTFLPFLAAVFLIFLFRRDFKFLYTLLIPLLLLCLWSGWNYFEYGSIHILDREGGEVNVSQVLAYLACLGSIAAFSIPLFYGAFPLKIVKWLILAVLSVLISTVILFALDVIPERRYANHLHGFFIVNGILVVFSVCFSLATSLKTIEFSKFLQSDRFVLFVIIGALSSFITLFAPFMATRHLLLVIPFILLVGHELIACATGVIKTLALVLAVILGIGLGLSDWKYADFYRRMALITELPSQNTTWTIGHWGWQWYAKKSGMKEYESGLSNVNEGDYFVFPLDVPKQKIPYNIRLKLIDKVWEEANASIFFSGHDHASMYISFNDKSPWRFSKSPIDTIYIYRVEKIDADN